MQVAISNVTVAVRQNLLLLNCVELWRLMNESPYIFHDGVVVASWKADIVFQSLSIIEIISSEFFEFSFVFCKKIHLRNHIVLLSLRCPHEGAKVR